METAAIYECCLKKREKGLCVWNAAAEEQEQRLTFWNLKNKQSHFCIRKEDIIF